ncbi:MAG: acyloxyacyl hydrolase [Bacteroidota bacterium]|nr:acyloxyacyl hydrolase [Bacteroidota bacterium]
MKNKKRIVIKLLFLIILFLFSAGQRLLFGQNLTGNSYEIRYHKSVILPHYSSFKYYSKEPISAVEFNFKFPTLGNKPWHSAKKYPNIGIGLFYSGLNNNDFLGRAFGIQSLVDFRLISFRKFFLDYRFVFGAVYLTKPFNLQTNPYNVVIGSHVNALVQTGFDAGYQFLPRWQSSVGFSLIHFSNGTVKKPNAGLNQLSLNLKLAYTPNFKEKAEQKFENFEPKNGFTAIVSGGFHQTSLEYHRLFFAGDFVLEYNRIFSRGSGFDFGTDLFFDNSIAAQMPIDSVVASNKQDAFYIGMHAGYSFITGKLSFILQGGPYISRKPYSTQSFFTRFGFRYKINKFLIANLTLKTYFAKADFIEWGVGYYLN